jgi:hypothetical protein
MNWLPLASWKMDCAVLRSWKMDRAAASTARRHKSVQAAAGSANGRASNNNQVSDIANAVATHRNNNKS